MNLHDISNFAKVTELPNDLCGLMHTVEARLYKPEGRVFDSRWFIGIFHWRNSSGRTMALGQGRIKLFGAPRQWKHFRPLFQAVFLSGGDYPPDWV